jgi:hypothetical protein
VYVLNSIRIWILYQRLALCLRNGSTSPESTLLSTSSKTGTAADGVECRSSGIGGCDGTDNIGYNGNVMGMEWDGSGEVAYSVTEIGMVIMGMSTSKLEVYATYPATVSVVAASGLMTALVKAIEQNIRDIFQLGLH